MRQFLARLPRLRLQRSGLVGFVLDVFGHGWNACVYREGFRLVCTISDDEGWTVGGWTFPPERRDTSSIL